ncbi:hypothetical protein Dimus_036175 [Dionaea muscipula]
METGSVVVEKIGCKSTATRCFSKYPLKFIIPNKVGPSTADAVWIYSLTYGGGIVSGDSISCNFSIGDGCIAVLTTQASTKVYKSVGNKCSQQILEALLEQGSISSISEQMQDYQVIAMIILLGPKLRHLQSQVQENVTKMMSGILHTTSNTPGCSVRSKSGFCSSKPDFIASCSVFGPMGAGLVIRVAATTTEAIYQFLRVQLAYLEPLIGVPPYR